MRRLLPLLLVLFGWTATVIGANWSNWRGPEQIGVARDRDLPDSWSPKGGKGSNLVWRAPVGSISTPIVQDGQVYIITRTGSGVGRQEMVVALNADTGKQVWQHKFNVWLTDIVFDRVCWAHMAGDPETGNVYSHGTQGLFTCFSKGGKVLWQHSLTEEFGRISGYGGRLPSPIVDEGLVIQPLVCANWGEHTVGGSRFIAFDKRTGKVVWWASGGYPVRDTHYSNPVVAVINGQRLMVAGGGDGCAHAFKVRTGEKVWSYLFSEGGINCTPVVQGNRIWIGHGEENSNGTQGRVICLDASQMVDGKPKKLWEVDGIKVKYASPVLHEGLLYLCDDLGNMFCLDAASGKQLWDFSYGSNTRGSPVWADGKLYVGELDGQFHILKPSKDDCKDLSPPVEFRPKGAVPVEIHSSPAIVNGRIYFTTTEETFCLGKPGHKAKADKARPTPQEKPLPKGAKATHLQVFPADVTLKPGESVELKVRAFDDHGRLIGEVEAEWRTAGPRPPVFPVGAKAPPPPKVKLPPRALAGELSVIKGKGTKLTIAKAPAGQFGQVVASFGGLTGSVRVRVAPTLPYSQNFNNVPLGQVPGGWVNTQGKFTVVRLPDGSLVLSKRNDLSTPLVARANAFISVPWLSDYDVESDVMGTQVGADLPEMGIGACRYSLVLIGKDQELRLVSWDAQKRINEVLKFPHKPNTWYRMKLSVAVRGGKGIVKGKVWPRGQAEPKNWTVEVEDAVPNTEGAPYLYGWSTGIINNAVLGTNIYYANVKVTK